MITRAIILLVTGYLVASSASAQLVPENTTVQLGEHSYAIPDQGIGGVPNVGIIVGDRATLVIDPGLGERNGETVLREVAKISSNTELYIATTHYHPEHTTGIAAFPDSAIYINSVVQETENMENGERVIQRFSGRSALMGELLLGAGLHTADITYDRQYSLDLGGVTVEFLVVGPTHTVGDTGFFVAQDKVLFSGDVVMNNSFVSANAGSSLTAWLTAFDLFEDMGPETIVPAHGEIGDDSSINILRDILSGIQTRARELKAAGVSVEDTGTRVQAEMEALHPDWSRANGVSALAQVAWANAPN
jgi:glyoxylase-like metal-dependent hydrolase (beta-lactamase superfamily II)|tara:strand:- start:2453 stop:3367 length:915 start_codon:yes stop_codon:yes gene_type:complete